MHKCSTHKRVLGLAAILLAAVGCSHSNHDHHESDSSKAMEPVREVLFDGSKASLMKNWEMRKTNEPAKWVVNDDGSMRTVDGDIVTKEKFQDFQLHVEFWVPNMPPNVTGQGRGNSGVYLQSRYEIQILDSFALTPGKGDCGAIYSIKAPDVNACKPPEQWQTYDITFHAAKFDAAGKKTEDARVTVLQNDIKVQDNADIPHPTGQGDPETPAPGSIRLQYHHNNVQFRNIWIQRLP